MDNDRNRKSAGRVGPKPESADPDEKANGRRQRRAAETRLKLFRAALGLFAERGFSNVTVEDITEAADVGKGTFFNYFATKDHVLGVMAEIQLAKVREAAGQSLMSTPSIHDVLHGLALRLVEEPGRSPALARAVISSFVASDVVRGLLENRLMEGRNTVAQLVEQGQKRGEIDAQLNKSTVALQFQRTLMGTILFWSLHSKPSLAKSVEDSFQLFWRGIAAARQESKS